MIPDEPLGKIGGDGTERRFVMMNGNRIRAIVLALLLVTVVVVPTVSATGYVNPPTVSDVTKYSFTVSSWSLLNKYSFVTYWLKDNPSYKIRTPITETSPYYKWTITVPGRWGGRMVSYQICTMDAPYKWTRMDCEKVQTVQLGKWRYPAR